MEPGIYGTDGTDPEEASGVLEPEDTLEDTARRARRARHRAGRRPSGPGRSTTGGRRRPRRPRARASTAGSPRELPDDADDEGDGLGDSSDTDGELLDDEVGDVRAGRLVDADDGGDVDTDDELYARDEGIDGAAASAEEAAVHIVRDRD